MQVTEDSILVNKEIRILRQELQMDFLIPALVRNESLIVPSGELEIQPRDILYILGSPETSDPSFRDTAGYEAETAKDRYRRRDPQSPNISFRPYEKILPVRIALFRPSSPP